MDILKKIESKKILKYERSKETRERVKGQDREEKRDRKRDKREEKICKSERKRNKRKRERKIEKISHINYNIMNMK